VDGDGPDAILDRLNSLYPKAIDLSLDRVRGLLADLGDPQDRLAPVIHVAGTNGKGSTIAYLRAIFEAAGYRAHVYTSPHLVRFNERIRLAGRIIDDPALAAFLAEVEKINAGRPVTLFEVTTAAAFLAFASVEADVVLLETGLGGRLDATNVVDSPAACALTSISLDHPDFLGHSLAGIAVEKAGILKTGTPAVIGPQPGEAAAVIAARANELGSPLSRSGIEWTAEPEGEGFRYAGRRSLHLPLPGLPGRHQIDNAGVALAVLDQVNGFTIKERHIAEGLGQVEWPARLQLLKHGPLVAKVPAGTALYLDGGHNESGGLALAEWAASRRALGSLDVVLAMRATKSPATFLAHLAPHVRRFRAVSFMDGSAWIGAGELAALAEAAGVADAKPAESAEAAVAELAADPPDTLLICGSLYFAGKILAQNE